MSFEQLMDRLNRYEETFSAHGRSDDADEGSSGSSKEAPFDMTARMKLKNVKKYIDRLREVDADFMQALEDPSPSNVERLIGRQSRSAHKGDL